MPVARPTSAIGMPGRSPIPWQEGGLSRSAWFTSQACDGGGHLEPGSAAAIKAAAGARRF